MIANNSSVTTTGKENSSRLTLLPNISRPVKGHQKISFSVQVASKTKCDNRPIGTGKNFLWILRLPFPRSITITRTATPKIRVWSNHLNPKVVSTAGNNDPRATHR